MTSTSNISVTVAQSKDRDVLISFFLKLLQHLDAFEHDFLPTLENAEKMVDHVFLPAATRNEAILIAWEQDKAVGAIFWAIQNSGFETRYKSAFGYGTYVLPEYQGKSVSKLLRKAAKEYLQKLGVQKIIGMVHFKNEKSLKASDSFGFKPHARVDLLDLDENK